MRSVLKPEVDLIVFLRMRSDTMTTNGKHSLEMQCEALISCVYMFFGTRNTNLRSILKPEVELMVFLGMHSNKIAKNVEKCP